MKASTATPAAAADTDDAALRNALHRLLDAVDAELTTRRRDASLEPAGTTPVNIEQLSSITRDLRGLAERYLEIGREFASWRGDSVTGRVRAAFDVLNTYGRLAAQKRRGVATVDEFGFDREWTETLLPIAAWIYRNWWHVRSIGIENVPASGRALLVSNHAGVFPFDGGMIRTGIMLEHRAPRHARALVLDAAFAAPVLSWFMRRTGNTLANMHDAEQLLRRDELVLVFPEGARGTGKLYRDRYRLRRFGRGGFAEVAIRTQSPIIPISVVGSEEVMPMLRDSRLMAKAVGMPYFPITPTFPWLGLAGLVPLPTSWVITYHQPIHVFEYRSEDADDPAVVMSLSDRVRNQIQEGIYRNLELRRRVFA